MIKCLFLVEGPYDLLRLSLLKGLFDENKLEIVPLAGDKLTTNSYFKKYEEVIRHFLNVESTHSYEDFDLFAQICDTDGCFISDEAIVENLDNAKIKYFRDRVEINDIDSIIRRNKTKRDNINALLKSGKIELFYNSCNIDDVFDGKLNPRNKQKKRLAVDMYNKYSTDLPGFIDLLFNSDYSGASNHKESWDYIKIGQNSLSPTTNLKFFLINHIDDLKNEFKDYIAKKYLKVI